MKCPECSRKIVKDAAFCPVCGAPQSPHVAWYDRDGRRILRLIKPHIKEGETVREYTVGNVKRSPTAAAAAGFLFNLGVGLLDAWAGGSGAVFGAAISELNSMLVLTNTRVLIVGITGWSRWWIPLQITHMKGIMITQVKGIEYERGPVKGTLSICHDEAEIEFTFWQTRWGRHAESIAALCSQACGAESSTPG